MTRPAWRPAALRQGLSPRGGTAALVRHLVLPQLSRRLRDARTTLADRRTMRVAHRRLADELASFRTTAERAELDELLSRHTSEETRRSGPSSTVRTSSASRP